MPDRMTSPKWAPGNKVVDVVTNEVGVIAHPPASQSEPSEYCPRSPSSHSTKMQWTRFKEKERLDLYYGIK